jgi:threonylcarbamoyladenosine tRNA methylthiotransferase MtaB
LQKLINLGCKLNQYEGYCLLRKFSNIEDLVIVNTCCVTREAEIKSQKKYHQALRKFPESTVIATGCDCRIHPRKYTEAQHVIDNVARNTAIKDILPKPDKARYFLKIQDGCNMPCTYCIVSTLRTRLESKPVKKIKHEITWAYSQGYKEIVLVGANIGLYGKDIGTTLEDLLASLVEVPDMPRIRLSSIEPFFLTEELLNVMKDLPICRHFHVPVQSADNIILKKMRRNYDRTYLEKTIDLIHAAFSDCAIGADIIVGFPGEGEKGFLNTYEFLRAQPFTHLHVFPYSPRPGTEAYELGDPVPRLEKKRRLWELKNLVQQKNHEFRKQLINKHFGVIVEHKNGKYIGLTDNYIRVDIDQKCPEHDLSQVKVTDVSEDNTYASLCENTADV